MTGWAQVRYGYANDLAEEMEKLTYDLYYVKHRSVGLDLRILVETLATVVRGRRRLMGKPRIPAVRESPIPDPVPRC
jgi:lipopolysaccharide/colanic/teichoic acid biosynthesis glycosyltransferase